jgi:hypothetical protein
MTKFAMCGPGLFGCDAGDFGFEEKYDGSLLRGGLLLCWLPGCLERSAEAKSSRVVEGVQLITVASSPKVLLATCDKGVREATYEC